MRFISDENVPALLADFVGPCLPAGGTFHTLHAAEPSLISADDDAVLDGLTGRYDVLVTQDGRMRTHHLDALTASRLHWLHIPEPTRGGERGVMEVAAALLRSLPHFLDALDKSGARAPLWMKCKGLQREVPQAVAFYRPGTTRELKGEAIEQYLAVAHLPRRKHA